MLVCYINIVEIDDKFKIFKFGITYYKKFKKKYYIISYV